MRNNTVRAMFAVAVLSIFSCAAPIFAADSAQQTVAFEIQAINEIAVSGAPSLTVNAATAGSAPTEVSDALSTYAYTSNQSRKITAALNTNMPAGVTLKVNMEAPTTGTSGGDKVLTSDPIDVVTAIAPVNESGKTITYKLSATAAAGVVASDNKTVTYTIVASGI